MTLTMHLGAGRPAAGWWHPKAVLALDFLNDRHVKAGARLPHGRVLSTVRSSTHLLTDSTGAIQTFGPNTLAALQGVGAYIGGQTLNLLLASTAFTAPLLWTRYGSPAIADNAALAPDGAMAAASFSGAAGGAYLLTQNLNVTAGQKYTLSVWLRGAAGGEKVRIDLKNQTSGGVSGTLFTLTSGWKRYSVTLTADATAQRGFQLRVESGFGNPDFTFFMWNAQAEAGGFASPDIVSPADAQGVRLASDVRAIASGSEPFAGWAAAGLGAGFSVLATVNLSHIGDGVVRMIAGTGTAGSGSSRVSAYIGTTGNLAMGVTDAGGADTVTVSSGVVALGRFRVALRAVPGDYRIKRTGAVAGTSSNATEIPAAPSLFLGLRPAGTGHLNDILENLQVCRPLTDAEMDDWVAS
jgi:hypothetical protein